MTKGVKVGGVTIKRISGHNAKYLLDNGIGPGSVIQVIRSGDVIPKVHSVIKKAKMQYPDVDYVWDDNHVNLIQLDSKNISTVQIKSITEFFRTIGVEDFAQGLVSKLYNDGLDTILKIVKATPNRLMKIDGIQDTTANKIVDNIHSALNGVFLYKLMAASNEFGRALGSTLIEIVTNSYPNILNLKNIYNKVIDLPGFSDTRATAFEEGLIRFKEFYNSIRPYVRIVEPKDLEVISNKMKGHLVLFTGVRDKYVEDWIVSNGGNVVSTISKATILIVKDNSYNSSKVVKAKEMGITIVTLDKFKNKYKL